MAYHYDAADRLTDAWPGNCTNIEYAYDDADRLTEIHHRVFAAGPTILRLEYEYVDDPDNPERMIGPPEEEQVDGRPLIWRITETDAEGDQAWVTFAYDARGRLIEEKREELPPGWGGPPAPGGGEDGGGGSGEGGGTQQAGDFYFFGGVPFLEPGSGNPPGPVTVYELSYTYDALGNRLVKTDYQAGWTTFYHYDVHEAADAFASHNNRLQWYRVYNGVFVAEPDPAVVTPLEEVMYIYDAGGHPVVIARKTDGDPVHDGLRLVYSAGGQLWLAMSYNWECDGAGAVLPGSVECTAVREFRYETGRARYLLQDRDPTTLDVISGTEHWSEYDSDTIYADYDIISDSANVTRMYLPGIAQMAAGATNAEYFHGDQVGTTRAMTDSTYPAQVVRLASYTAFGEAVDSTGGTDTRYGYAGAHGYEEALLPGWDFVHVGARWYDPSSGRFLQRDPIGIQAGLNVYAYVRNNAVASVDPSGELLGNPSWRRFSDGMDPQNRGRDVRNARICAPKPKSKSPQRELEEVKKTARAASLALKLITTTLGALVGGPGGAAGGFVLGTLPEIIDQAAHPNEPLNPAYGGSYDNWYK